MASIGSLPSLLDPLKGPSPILLQSRTRTLLESNGSACKMRLARASSRRQMVGLSLVVGEKGKGLRATRKSGGVEGQEDQDEDDEGIADDALRATIKQSKKVLAVQRDLLQQIVERRKLISSVQSSVVNTEHDTVTYDESDSSFSNLDQSSTDKKYSSDTHLTEAELSGDPPVGANRSIIDEEKEARNSSQVEHSLADALGLSREAGLEADQSKIISPSLSKVLESYGVKDEKLEDLTEANVDIASAKDNAAPDEGNVNSPPLAGTNVMNVILVSAECAPWSKTGGLGDVAGALPKALARRGHRVMVVSPRYGIYAEPQEMGVRKIYKVDGQDMEVSYSHVYIDGVDFVFMESPMFRHREKDIYGGNRMDILKRMVLLCKAAVEVPWHVPCGGACYGDGNLVFIANDWHTALLPVYLRAYYRDHDIMKYARCVLVIHNIAHQGRGPLDEFRYVDLPGHYIDLFKLYDPMGGDHLNIFAAGLKTADRVVTVSQSYAWELKTSEGGWGLHEIINENDWKFHGIVNGIDAEDWNPKLDVHLKSDGYTTYSLETLQTGKPQCKAALQRELGLQVRDDVPLIGFIGRLDHQKGVDLIADAIHWMVGQDMQLVMLGTGRADLEETLRRLERQHNDKVRAWVGFSVRLAHRITAGADILLMPSRFEPCGLNQLYAMMYGTVPVVHAVGGLKDTVHQFDPYSETGLGWTFDRAEANRLIDALMHCLKTYRNYKKSWEGLQRRGMMQDLSWDNAAQQYEEVLVAAKYQW